MSKFTDGLRELSGEMLKHEMDMALPAGLPDPDTAAGIIDVLEKALRQIYEGFGPNHMSRFCQNTARDALAKLDASP